MLNKRTVTCFLGGSAFIATTALTAQTWQGFAAFEMRVVDRKKKPIEGAEIALQYRQNDSKQGPPALRTDSSGRATAWNLAQGTWYLEVRHPDYLAFVAVLDVRVGDKPRVTTALLQATGGSVAPMRVKFSKAKGEAPPPRQLMAEAPPSLPSTPAPTPSPVEVPGADGEEPRTTAASRPAATPAPPPAAGSVEPPVSRRPSVAPAEVPVRESAPPAAEHEPAESPAPARPPTPSDTPTAAQEPAAAEPPTLTPPTPPVATPPPPIADERRERAAPPPEAPPTEVPPVPLAAAETMEPPASETVSPVAAPPPAPPTPPPAPVAAIPAPGRLGPVLRHGDLGTCQDCLPNEWAVSSEGVAGTARPGVTECPAGITDGAARAMWLLANAPELELSAFAGSAADDSPDTARGRVDAGRRQRFEEILAPYAGGHCKVLGVVLPKGAQMARFRLLAADGTGISLCDAGQECPIRDGGWIMVPRVGRGPTATVVFGVFQNLSTESARRVRLTAYFTPPSRAWRPPASRSSSQ